MNKKLIINKKKLFFCIKICFLFISSLFLFNYLGLIVHEIGGHALTQKLVGGGVRKIEVGNVKIFSFTKSGTKWKFGLFPIRGCVTSFNDSRMLKIPLFWKEIIVLFMGYIVEIIFFWLIYRWIKKKEKGMSLYYFIWGKSVFRWALMFLMIITTLWNCPFLRTNDFTHIAEMLIYGKRTNTLHLFETTKFNSFILLALSCLLVKILNDFEF